MALSEPMKKALGNYIDLNFMDPLSPAKRKKDGKYYTTYIAELQSQCTSLAPEHGSVILKEISPAQAAIYQKLSTIWNPYIETVFGVAEAGGQYVSINEFVQKPSYLVYSSPELAEKRSLSLEDYVNEYGCLSEAEAIIFLIQLCRGLESIAALSLVHGDVAPQNILLTDRSSIIPEPYMYINGLHQRFSCKLIDFDITSQFKNENHMVTVVAGTNPYAAPEILDYKNSTKRVDIYSLGCVLCFMITGRSPKQLSAKEMKTLCSPRIRNLIAKCTADYSKRYHRISSLRHHLEKILSFYPLPKKHLVDHLPGFHTEQPLAILYTTFLYIAVIFLILILQDPDFDFALTFSLLAFLFLFAKFIGFIEKKAKIMHMLREFHPVWYTMSRFLLLSIILLFALASIKPI